MATVAEWTRDLDERALYEDFVGLFGLFLPQVTAWQSGEPGRALGSIVSRFFARKFNAAALPALRARWLEFASGDWLTLEAWTTYGTLRKAAAFAGGSLTVVNTAGGNYPLQAGQVRVRNASGKTFTNVTGGTLPPWSGSGPFPTLPNVQFRADEPGTASNTPVGGIAAVPVAAPLGVEVLTNTTEWLGQDRQDDESLRRDARAAPSQASVGGPRLAYEFVARRTRRPDGTEPGRLLVEKETDVAVNVTRVAVRTLGGALLEVWLASPSGPAEGNAATAGTDVYLVNRAIQQLVVPEGFGVTVAAAPAISPTFILVLEVDAKANVTQAQATATAQASLQAWTRTLPIGGRKLSFEVSGGGRYVQVDEVRRFAALAVDADGRFTTAPGVTRVNVFAGEDTPILYNQVATPTYIVSAVLVSQ